jgi:anti-sigma regulatory factor (Ser/Thr protein kinase)
VDEVANAGTHAASVDARNTWAANPIHLQHIRAQTRRWLAPLELDQDTEQDLILAVNEAVSNAIDHAYTAPKPTDLVQVSFWTRPHHLYLEIADHGRWRQPDTDPAHRGRGILLMRQTAESVSIHTDPDGTRVRLRHPLA